MTTFVRSFKIRFLC